MHEIFKQKDLPYLNVQQCPNCHQNIPAYEKICPECNYDLTSFEEKVEEEKQIVLPKEEPDLEEKQDLCPNCHKKIDLNKEFCGYCGFKFKVNTCLCCGETLDNDLLFCPNCGTKKGEKGLVITPISENSLVEKEVVVETLPQAKEEQQEIIKSEENVDLKVKKYLCKKRLTLLAILITLIGALYVLLFTDYIGIHFEQFSPVITGQERDVLFVIRSTPNLRGAYILKTGIMDLIQTKSIHLDETTMAFLSSGWGEKIAKYMPFVIFGFYAITFIAFVVAFICNLCALFTRKLLKTRSFGIALWFYALLNLLSIAHMIVLYKNHYYHWQDFNSFNLIAFAVVLFIWVIIKISFLKNNKDEVLKNNLVIKKENEE